MNTKTRGFSLIEVLLAAGLTSLLVLALSYILGTSVNIQRTITQKGSMMTARNNALIYLLNDTAWQKTVDNQKNGAFKCLFTGVPCATTGIPFKIYDTNAALYYDPATSTTTGFTDTGAPCNDYPSVSCRFRLVLKWYPICSSCFPAQLRLIGQFATAPRGLASGVLNAGAYGFNLIKTIDNIIIINLTANTDRFNLFSYLRSPASPEKVIVNISPGVFVYSSTSATPAFDTGPMPSGSDITINNNGWIEGAGGVGGTGAPSGVCGCQSGGAGGAGGTGLYVRVPVAITNAGTIAGGGGGGGGGGAECSYVWNASAGGGGGGAGLGRGGSTNGCGVSLGRYGSTGGAGSFTSGGGQGWRGNTFTCNGGRGGAPGQWGSSGQSCNAPGGRGGAPGDAIVGNSNISWSRLGSIIGSTR